VLCCINGDLEFVRVLLQHGGLDFRDEHLWAHPDRASEVGHVDVVRFLLERGADVNALSPKDVGRSSALHMASLRGLPAVARVFSSTAQCGRRGY
jgi:ankyrin repeat protein